MLKSGPRVAKTEPVWNVARRGRKRGKRQLMRSPDPLPANGLMIHYRELNVVIRWPIRQRKNTIRATNWDKEKR
jgi:hypothetical protein